jgi:EXS family
LTLRSQDVPALIRYPPRQFPHQTSHHTSTYHLATLLTIPLVISLLLFWAVTRGSADLVGAWETLPQSYFVLFTVLLLLPFHRLSRSGRHRFFVALRRVSIGGLAEAQDGKFGDILLSDALTSYSKVFAELFISLCMFFSSDASSTGRPNRNCGGDAIVPLIVAIPFIIRLRQCLIEFWRVRSAGSKSSGWGGQHLANALKYATAFPVIIFTALHRNYSPQKTSGLGEPTISYLW